jgi:hypothetical protein
MVLPACVSNQGPVSDVDFLDADTPSPPVSAPEESGLPLAIKQRFPDIPLPADLREDAGRTYVYQAPGLDIGRMVYTTRDSVRDVAQFFIRELPTKDWTLRSSTQAENSVDLIFTKQGKRLEIKVSSGGMTRSNELVLHLVPQADSGGNLK